MSYTQFRLWQAVQAIGRGVWFSQSVLAKHAGCSPQTARRHLLAWSEDGQLKRAETIYNGHIRQSLFMWESEE